MRVLPSHGVIPLLVAALAGSSAAAWKARVPERPRVIMYKGASCTCCPRWGKLLTHAGFRVEVLVPGDLNAVFVEHGIAPDRRSCHLAVVEGYAVVGHVPIAEIQRMLRERRAIAGIAVPGMPATAPGMDLPTAEPVPFDVLAFTRDGGTSVYARY